MGYWKLRVVLIMKKLFERILIKKVLVVEVSKFLIFDDFKVFIYINYNDMIYVCVIIYNFFEKNF